MSNKIVLMIVDNYIPFDTRVWQEACALRDNGYNVKIICQYKKGQPKGISVKENIKVIRTNKCQKFSGIFGYGAEYSTWLFNVFRLMIKEKFDIIHTANPPDFYFPILLFYKMVNKMIVVDIHDLCPELYQSRMNYNKILYKILVLSELITIKLANIVIVTNESYKQIMHDRNSKNKNEIFIVRNAPDLNRMKFIYEKNYLRKNKKILLGYIGNINPQDGVENLINVANLLVNKYKKTNFKIIVMGDGDSLPELKIKTNNLKLNNYIEFMGRVSNYIANCVLSNVDICVAPDSHNPLNDSFTSTKIMEYMFYKKPIVAYNLKETIYSAEFAALYSLNDNDFAINIITLIKNPNKRKEMGNYGHARVMNEINWNKSVKSLIIGYTKIMGQNGIL